MAASAGRCTMDSFEVSSISDIPSLCLHQKCGISAALFLSLQHFIVRFIFLFRPGKRGHFEDGIQSKML